MRLRGPRIVDPGPSFRMQRLWVLWHHDYNIIVTWRHESTRRRHFLIGSVLDKNPQITSFPWYLASKLRTNRQSERHTHTYTQTDTQTDTSTDNKGRFKLAAREPTDQHCSIVIWQFIVYIVIPRVRFGIPTSWHHDTLPLGSWKSRKTFVRSFVSFICWIQTVEKLQQLSRSRPVVWQRMLTLWRPLLLYGYSHKSPCARPG